MDRLRDTIQSYASVEPNDLDYALTLFKKVEAKKGDFLLKEGQIARKSYFVDDGCLCLYSLRKGQKQVIEFFTEGHFCVDLLNYLERRPTNTNIWATEDTTAYAIDMDDNEKLWNRSHALERFGRKFITAEFITLSKRIAQMNNLSNEERYLRIMEKRPDLIQRVPQYLIASYLGLTPVGLSKIRKRLSLSSS
ncbi:MAG: Crp/Fnr family transcriptional regulator [Bacteroidota bacterium]